LFLNDYGTKKTGRSDNLMSAGNSFLKNFIELSPASGGKALLVKAASAPKAL